MATDTPKPKRRSRMWLLLIALAVFGTALIVGSLSVVQAECELCVTFRGQTQCRRGSGADDAAARDAAQKAACAVMASGMNESIACGNTPPTNVRCPAD